MTAQAPAQSPKAPSRRRRAVWIAILVIVVLIIAFFITASLSADLMWFQQLHFSGVLLTQWGARIGMFCVGFLAMGVPVWLSITIAYRLRPVYAKLGSQVDRYQEAIEPLRRVATWLVPAVLGLIAGLATAGQWDAVALFLNRTPFGQVDPQFGLDLSFYFFELPFYRGIVSFALWAVALSAILAFLTVWLYGSLRISGRSIRISRAARVQLAVTLGVWVLFQAVSIWLDQYSMLTETTVGFLKTGAGFTGVTALIPGKVILAGAALVVAILCFVTAVIGRWRFPLVGLGSLIVLAIVIGSVYPWIVQRLQVEPSAQSIEAPYIQREIDATRAAYGVSQVDVVPYTATTDAEAGALRQDATTTANIRIIDPAIAPLTFKQLQQFKQYYSFDDMDVDRYTIDGKVQDTIIAARDVNLGGLDAASQSWYNDVLVYTHGYGVVAAYGNQRESDGQPRFFESGIPTTGDLGTFEPRIYFGESSPEYSIVGAPEGSSPVELDYPSSSSDSALPEKTTFTGDGGPKLDSLFSRMVYAIKFQSSEILFSSAVNEDSQILYDRSPLERVQKVAPYLTLDSDPYPAVVDGRIVWIVDGYTTSAMYPYSESRDMNTTLGDAETSVSPYQTDDINYIRNSVKATVDAYDGQVNLYAWDPTDPVLQTWEKVFPGTVQPSSAMSPELLAHVRYPEDLFKVQRDVLGTYHVTDTASFFSGDDQWVTPADPVASNGGLQPPYYLTMQVPDSEAPGYTLYSTYIPKSTSSNARQVLTGYLAANGDAGPDYGKLTLLTLPTQSIPAPGQVFTNFKTNTTVSGEVLSLTAGGGNQIVYGNLLTLPVGGGLLYVQPVYVQASSGTTFPLLRKVLVSFGDSIAFEDTLDEALDQLFGGDSGASAGDSGEGGDGSSPTTPGDGSTSNPGDGSTPTSPPTGTPTAPPTTVQDPAALQQALADYQQALADRTAAYAKGDLVAAAQADQRMRDAIARAMTAAGD